MHQSQIVQFHTAIFQVDNESWYSVPGGEDLSPTEVQKLISRLKRNLELKVREAVSTDKEIVIESQAYPDNATKTINYCTIRILPVGMIIIESLTGDKLFTIDFDKKSFMSPAQIKEG